MDFNTVYAQKLTTADRVAALVKDDDWVDYGWAIGTPVSFDAALAKRLPELHGIKFRGGILCHVPEIFKIENQAEHFCWNSWHMGGIERKAVAAGYAYYSPLRYSELPRYYRESPDPLNIAVFVVAPMDSHGYFNLGPCASHLADAARKADKVFVEVNKNMPVCLGGYDNCLHISQVDGIIEGDNPPIDHPQRRLPAAWHRRHAQRHRRHDCRERPERFGRTYRDVCGLFCRYGKGWPHYRPL